ncbi:MAG: substrate-binding domain-containing protein [Planctomycetota bacterium]
MTASVTSLLSRIAAISIGALGLATLAACDGGTPASSNGGAATAQPETTTAGGSATAAPTAPPQAEALGRDRYVIGMVAKSSANPVYIAARAGAEAAARDILEQEGVQVELAWRTPLTEDASRQAELVAELMNASVDGIALSATDPLVLAPAINRAAARGVRIVTFDADVPGSARFAYYGIDDGAAGATVMDELAKAMPGGGRVAVLAGNRTADNISRRVLGVVGAMDEIDGYDLVGVFGHPETPEDAVAAMAKAHVEHGPIDGWALVGGWPLYAEGGLEGVPESVEIVSIDLLPATLDYLESGRVRALVGQPYFGWGYESVQILFNSLHKGEMPSAAINAAEHEIATPSMAPEFRERWASWVGRAN